jgi:stage IV sporulation protein FA
MFLCIILFLIVGILCKSNLLVKNFIKNKVYEEHISFSSFKNFYNHYLGGIFPMENMDFNSIEVFDEKLVYSSMETYEDGVSLMVVSNYLVPSINDGIVVYIGKKDRYQQVVMVENNDGVDVWYGNLCNINVELYDSIEAGSYLGEVCDNYLYLVFSKGNQYLDFHDYLE